MKLDILVFAAHPDDAELACGGTIAKYVAMGKKIGIVDLTQGELSSRGDVPTRKKETENSSKILGITIRENLLYRDGFFEIDEQHLLGIIKKIRKYQPELILCNAIKDRHPDHSRAGELVARANFLSGLLKIESLEGMEKQKSWRARKLFHYIQEQYVEPSFVVDISNFIEQKIDSIRAFESQFYKSDATNEPKTKISSEDYIDFIIARSKEMGNQCNFEYAEGFSCNTIIGVDNIFDIH
ncbi:MAG: bacillithiol biosynthesis deacetylase BshB1 [Sphingobacteriales bacterium]|jgi:bacillithiol biosynthesis deacetylase BshB1|nr:MAG: bacillithiol biosynthesis deacetylase BshB1 [Sphingobacteriales bacterium]